MAKINLIHPPGQIFCDHRILVMLVGAPKVPGRVGMRFIYDKMPYELLEVIYQDQYVAKFYCQWMPTGSGQAELLRCKQELGMVDYPKPTKAKSSDLTKYSATAFGYYLPN